MKVNAQMHGKKSGNSEAGDQDVGRMAQNRNGLLPSHWTCSQNNDVNSSRNQRCFTSCYQMLNVLHLYRNLHSHFCYFSYFNHVSGWHWKQKPLTKARFTESTKASPDIPLSCLAWLWLVDHIKQLCLLESWNTTQIPGLSTVMKTTIQ